MATDTAGSEALDRLERECTRFLYREAALLDGRRFQEWLKLLSPEIDYKVPVRLTRDMKDGDGFSSKAFFLEEDFSSLKLRVDRFDLHSAWSENPPSRTRRMVSNVRLANAADAAPWGDEHEIISNLAVFSFRGETAAPQTLTGERRDVLRREQGDWKIKRRLVLLDTTILGLESLSIFL